MTAERNRALNVIGFDWGLSKVDLAANWDVRFQEMCKFKAQFGHCLVPLYYSANPKLRRWVTNQRSSCKLYEGGKPSHMTAERLRELESVAFEWKPNCVSWNERFEQLLEFKVHFGNCLVPSKYSADPALGRWVSMQRAQYRLYQEGKPSHMTAERIRELESIEFKWKPSHSSLFATRQDIKRSN
jgi:hypothetical protein